MKSRYYFKKLVFWVISLIIFSGLSTYSVIYAAGWRYNPSAGKFQKTGLIFLNSDPKDVQVLLDNQLVTNQTPYLSTAFLPGNYDLLIKKTNYWSWQEEVKVKEGLAVQRPEIILFLENSEAIEVTEQQKNLLESSKKKSEKGVEVNVNGTELWYQDKLIGRWLTGITKAKVYNGGSHLSFIRESALYIVDNTGRHETKLIDDVNGDYVFDDKERILIYEASEGTKGAKIR